MTTDTDNTLRLHHSIKESVQPPPSDVGNDFAAAFSGDDDAPPASVQTGETAGEAGESGDKNISSQGVDTSENGAQVPPQPQGVVRDNLPDDLRQQVAAIIEARDKAAEEAAQVRRDFEAMKGRVAPVQRELDSAKQQLARFQQQAPQQQPQPQGAAAPPSAVALAQAHFESKAFKDFEAMYPEEAAIQKQSQLVLAQAQDAQATAVLRQLDQLNRVIHSEVERINRFEQERMSAAKRAELDELTAIHPDWQQINESDEFWDWFNSKTALFGIRSEDEMRRRVNDKAFVIEALNLYKASPQYAAPATQSAPAVTVAAEVTQRPANAALRLASAPRNTGGGVTRPKGPASAGDEFLAAFNSDD